MNAGTVGQAIGLFAMTNVDDLVLIALFFTQTTALRIVLGQYLGFAAILAIAGITFANGGDNIGVYVPVFATQGVVVYVVVFLVMVGVLCLAGHFLATRPVVARALAKWGHVLFPVVLVGIGVFILVGHT
ncbi:cadmium resistance transporter [Herbidospora cretacea]|uniref:cadmium resistance transporter n=1 Tax=Herbidospora cretacea TaxID=28444 RepID=UPI000774B55B|nr:cadmium resistance transporter [Herbidospora cretacea]